MRTLPKVTRERIVLPDGVLDRIERQAVSMARHADRLRAAGRHLRRGVLFHGPPGVGKTLTAMYLAALMPERTVVLLTGQGFGTVGPSVDLATALQPAMVVLEDVDLVALDRSYEPTNAILVELLNAMDGLDEDHDLLFVLTTNRPDLLEPALAARPGRVDLAVASRSRTRPAGAGSSTSTARGSTCTSSARTSSSSSSTASARPSSASSCAARRSTPLRSARATSGSRTATSLQDA